METTQNPGSIWVQWRKQSPAQTRTQGAGVLAGEGADLRGRGEAIQAACPGPIFTKEKKTYMTRRRHDQEIINVYVALVLRLAYIYIYVY
jgi:hypothetical protein